MPRYDYRCQQCGETFELRQGFDADPVTDCHVCGGQSHRLIHSVPVMFKGSGFYVNDYGRGNGARPSSPDSDEKKAEKESKKEKESESPPKAKSESSKESAPASKKG